VQNQAAPKKKRGQQPNRPAPKRRDYSHLPTRDELINVPEDDKVCACCGKPLADRWKRHAALLPKATQIVNK